MSNYTLTDLQELEARCQEKAAGMGLTVPEVLFHLVQAEEMYDIASRSLPGRYSHWSFGRQYEQEKSAYDKGRSRIYELVINTRPVYAYLMDGNSRIAQLLVMAHVLGHATVYEHNKFFGPADKNILSRTRGAAERIDGYMGEYGRDRVEDFIDACQSLQYQRSFAQLAKPRQPVAPKWEVKAFDVLFPQETKERRATYEEERDDFKYRFPKEPVRDLLEFFERNSRHLEDWQRDIISIIRMEMDYFTPMLKLTVLHEAQAVYYHNTIVQEMMAEDDSFTTDDFTEFQSMNARVLHPQIAFVDAEGHPYISRDQGEQFVQCTGVNPYLTGSVIYAEVKRICENPTTEEKEQWGWAGNISWEEKRSELVKVYDDASLLAEFCSATVCEKAKLFMEPRSREAYDHLIVDKDEAEQVRKELVNQKIEFGIPTIEIVDADYQRQGQLYMEHRHDGKVGLDPEYAFGTLRHIYELWGHTAIVHTIGRHPSASDEPSNSDELIDLWYYIQPVTGPQVRTSNPDSTRENDTKES